MVKTFSLYKSKIRTLSLRGFSARCEAHVPGFLEFAQQILFDMRYRAN